MPEVRYDNLVIDTVNLFYRVWNKDEKDEIVMTQKSIYKKAVCDFIKRVEAYKEKYLIAGGNVWLLVDNYFSRSDLQSAFMFADRKSIDENYKESRKKENRPFYQSLNFLRYYYLLNTPDYHTARIDGMEADDLVKPLIEGEFLKGRTLLISTDLDWAKYLSDNIDILNQWGTPHNIQDTSIKLGFPVSETSLIVYKALFGDPADNIPAILTKNDKNFEDFKKVLPIIHFPDQARYLARNDERKANSPVFKAIADNEQRFQINCQLISTMKCSQTVFKENLHTGRSETTLLKTVKEAIGLTEPAHKFTFGTVKRPRR